MIQIICLNTKDAWYRLITKACKLTRRIKGLNELVKYLLPVFNDEKENGLKKLA